MPPANPVNQSYRDSDIEAWNTYKKFPSPENRSALLRRFDGVINAQVNKWAGPVPREVLLQEARAHAARAFDTFDPEKAALATHITNAIKPISRTVYTYQNAIRAPENVTRALGAYKQTVSALTDINGVAPDDHEVSSELGWDKDFLDRVKTYDHRELLDSQPTVGGQFGKKDYFLDDEFVLDSFYKTLNDTEKALFSGLSGYESDGKPLTNAQLGAQLGLTPSQVSRHKAELSNKVEAFMSRPSLRGRFGG